MINAEIICDSISPARKRLTTFQLRYPRFIHAELMTHRMFSRNASSSRAIPATKNLEEVANDDLRAAPVYWGVEQKGMQAGAELSEATRALAQTRWAFAARSAYFHALALVEMGVHKSIANRLLEPFIHINVLVTSSEPGLMNFFGLRLDRAAQPELRVLAEKMWQILQDSMPCQIAVDDWHLPFIDDGILDMVTARKVSTARCARVSYLSFESGKRSTVEEDLRLYDRLLGAQPLHASPAEHQATPDEYVDGHWQQPTLHGNLIGWIQHRKLLSGEACAPLPTLADTTEGASA